MDYQMLYMEAFGFLGSTNSTIMTTMQTSLVNQRVTRHNAEQTIKISEKYTTTKCGVHFSKAMPDFVLNKAK
jgi:hypothetical protein